MKDGYVYILASETRTLYVGVTSDLSRRIRDHKHKLVEGFTKDYDVTRLVYYEVHEGMRAAIAREKQIKGWRRQKKIELIAATNPLWKDLADDGAVRVDQQV